MTDFITLLGSEDVARAGRNMQSAASQMDNAAGAIEDSLSRFLRELDSLVCRLETAASKASGPEDDLALCGCGHPAEYHDSFNQCLLITCKCTGYHGVSADE